MGGGGGGGGAHVLTSPWVHNVIPYLVRIKF